MRLSLAKNSTREKSERRASGRVGVPPAVLRVSRGTRRTFMGERMSLGIRVYSAGCGIRQAGRPPYPMHAVLPSLRCIRLFAVLCVLLTGIAVPVGAADKPHVLTLPEARAIALKKHPKITVADLKLLAAQQSVRQAP